MFDFPTPNSLCRTSLFADDIEFHTSANSNESAFSVLQPYLNRINAWSKNLCISFSVKKCALLIFSRKRCLDDQLLLKLNSQPIPIVTTFKFLGTHSHNWNTHVGNILLLRRLALLMRLKSSQEVTLASISSL